MVAPPCSSETERQQLTPKAAGRGVLIGEESRSKPGSGSRLLMMEPRLNLDEEFECGTSSPAPDPVRIRSPHGAVWRRRAQETQCSVTWWCAGGQPPQDARKEVVVVPLVYQDSAP